MKKKETDSIINAIHHNLKLGDFISYGRSWNFVSDLGKVKNEIDDIASNDPSRAIALYEVFLAGTYEKADEIDDSSGSLGDFFQEMFSDWIQTRQKAGDNPKDIVADIFRWNEHDDYGFCYNIEKEVSKVLNKDGLRLFIDHYRNEFEKAYAPFESEDPKPVFDYPNVVWHSAQALRDVFISRKDEKSYLELGKKILLSPKDCEKIAEIYISKKKYDLALDMIERGLKDKNKRDWKNQSSSSLDSLKKDVLGKMGRTDEALKMAWDHFKECPTDYGYKDLMGYVEKSEKKAWHEKALKEASNELDGFIEICVMTEEWELLGERILKENDKDIANLSHYTTEPAAKGLEKKTPLASAKLYFNMGNRIVEAKKSKYYHDAIENFKMARKLWVKEGQNALWTKIVKDINAKHSRKSSFIHDFNDIADGKPRQKTISEEKEDRILNYSKDKFFKKKK